jgi:hypothetical protein
VADARFCHRCGRAVADSPSERNAWIIAWSLVALSVAVIVWSVLVRKPEPAGGATAAATGTPPDISQMSPRERFLRLHDRVLGAAEQNDSATARRFAPMALQAYGMLDGYDEDLRFHAGLIHLVLGESDAAALLADTMQAEVPGHLLGEILRADAAGQRGDAERVRRSRQAFLAAYEREIAASRPEYNEHRQLIEEFRKQAGSP